MKIFGFKTITASLLAIGISTATLGAVPATANYVESCYEQNCTVWFSYTGGIQKWHPPVNARNMTFQVSGGQGGKAGGQGGRVTGTLTQIPSTLYVAVAGAGVTGQSAAGGFNGGGQAGSGSNNEGSGGGSSDIRLNTNVESRIVVAGGGGGRGAGITATASPGGGLIAAAGKAGQAEGGQGGSQTEGGIGGRANGFGSGGTAGSLLTGGQGGASNLYGGGGGGGGYYGGGGGGSDTDSVANDAGAGGGGSSFADPLYTSNITHFTGVKSGHGMVMIEYQLVPLFQSIDTPRQLTNASSVDFQIELSDPFPGFSVNHIQFLGDIDNCQPGKLTGNGTTYLYTVTDCVDGQVGIAIPANSILEQGYSGPETDQASTLVTIDRTAPEISDISKDNNLLTIPTTEPVTEIGDQSYSFTSESTNCLVDTVSAESSEVWIAALVGCEDASFTFTILENSVSDLAGNQGPTQPVTFEVIVPKLEKPAVQEAQTTGQPQSSVTPKPEESAIPPIEIGGPTPPPVIAPEPIIGDSEILEVVSERKQAAQAVIRASATSESVNSSLGWAVGLAIAGALLLAAGFSLRRRGVSDMLVS